MNIYRLISYHTPNETEFILNELKTKGIDYIGILHDKDKGECHYHLYIITKNPYSYNEVKTLIPTKANVFCQPFVNAKKHLEYLTHFNIKNKHKYDVDEVFYSDADIWKKLYYSEYTLDDDIVSDLLSDTYSVVDMARKYGRDFIKNIKSYEYFRGLALQEQARTEQYNYEVETIRRKQERLMDKCESLMLEYFGDCEREMLYNAEESDIIRLHKWYLDFQKNKTDSVPLYLLKYLLPNDREIIENKILYRQQRGKVYTFHDNPTYVMGVGTVDGVREVRQNIWVPNALIDKYLKKK